MKRNTLPLQKEVIWHFEYLKQKLRENSIKFERKLPVYIDEKEQLLKDVISLWKKSSLPVLSKIRTEAKIKDLIQKWKLALKRAMKSKSELKKDEWMSQLFDICKCKCKYDEVKVHQGKVLCSCPFEDRVAGAEIEFLIDQRGNRKMMLGWSKDLKFAKRAMEKISRMVKEPDTGPPSTSGIKIRSSDTYLTATKMRKRSVASASVVGLSSTSDSEDRTADCAILDPSFFPKAVTGGKKYKKIKTAEVSSESCTFADRRLTSIRQQSDQLLSVVGSEIAASPSTIFRKREKVRISALSDAEVKLHGSDFLQLCYDGRVVNKSDRYVFLGQFFNTAGSETEAVIAVKSFPCGTSVTSEVLFQTITTEACEGFLTKIYSLMADTTAVKSGKISEVNKRLRDYFVQEVGHDIHALECLFHVNEIYFTHVVSLVEGRKKGPGMMQEGVLYNKIITIQKPDTMANFSRENLPKISVTSIASLHLKAKLSGLPIKRVAVIQSIILGPISYACWCWLVSLLWMCRVH